MQRTLSALVLCVCACSENNTGNTMDGGTDDMLDMRRTDVPIGSVPKGLVMTDA